MEKVPEILKGLEAKHNIRIIYAIEAGSRAWGMESKDSDYDIRFVYIHSDPKKYLSLRPLKETIDGFSEDRLYDWQGWDITKTLRLINKMNPSIVEWLYSPITYMTEDDVDFVMTARKLIWDQNRVSPLLYHYRSMAKTNFTDHIENNFHVKIKKYLNVIRPVAMFEWLSKCTNNNNTLSAEFAIDFNKILVDLKEHLNADCYKEILNVIEKKKKSLNETPRIECIDKWIENVLYARNDELSKLKSGENNDKQALDDNYDNLLLQILNIQF